MIRTPQCQSYFSTISSCVCSPFTGVCQFPICFRFIYFCAFGYRRMFSSAAQLPQLFVVAISFVSVDSILRLRSYDGPCWHRPWRWRSLWSIYEALLPGKMEKNSILFSRKSVIDDCIRLFGLILVTYSDFGFLEESNQLYAGSSNVRQSRMGNVRESSYIRSCRQLREVKELTLLFLHIAVFSSFYILYSWVKI